VTKVSGAFERGDAITILDPDGREIARGLANLGRDAAELAKGKNSARIEQILGPDTRTEMVHRDNMVVLLGLEAKV
jgi:glutamate 5-kinase